MTTQTDEAGATTPKGRYFTGHAYNDSLRRHGFRPPYADIDEVIDNCSRKTYQRDGATVYIKVNKSRRRKAYSIVIVNEENPTRPIIITGIQEISPNELRNLAVNYGFDPGI